MLSINTNLSSLIAQNSMNTSTNKLNQAIERMTTGAKINHAKDNAANYSIATNMTTKIGAYQIAEYNALMGLDMVNAASENLSAMQNQVKRLMSLAIQAKNGTYGTQSLNAINSEANTLVDELELLYQTAEFNGINLLNDSEFIKPVEKRNTDGMTKLSEVDEAVKITSGVYSISTAEELAKLAIMTNNKKIGGGEFVLAADIDLTEYTEGKGWISIGGNYDSDGDGTANYSVSFTGTFDGNGFVIKNLTSKWHDSSLGLFGSVSNATIKNVALENVKIEITASVGTALPYSGGIIGQAGNSSKIENCYVKGNLYSVTQRLGGIVGRLDPTSEIVSCFFEGEVKAIGGLVAGIASENLGKITNSFAKGLVEGERLIGGITGYSLGTIDHCYSTADISSPRGDHFAVGLIAGMISGATATLNNCYSNASDISNSKNCGGIVGVARDGSFEITNCHVENATGLIGVFIKGTYTSDISITFKNCTYSQAVADTGLNLQQLNNTNIVFESASINDNFNLWDLKQNNTKNIQVGITSKSDSNITLSTNFVLNGFSLLRNIGLDNNDYISMINDYLLKIEQKQTELGAVQNRLSSALDEISIQYENLVSSRSTIKDADMAELSSTYIQQQILQQAAATLMATANQSPAIALQLL